MADQQPVFMTYTNYAGITATRYITPRSIWFGSTQWHPEPQWLLKAHDHQRSALRDFAMADIAYWGAKPPRPKMPSELCPAAPEDDPGHCEHWYDCEPCHRCGDNTEDPGCDCPAHDRYRVRQAASEVYDEEGVEIWMHAPNRSLGGATPIDLCLVGMGDWCLQVIERLTSGAFS